jgi:hypothetical protein
MSQENRASHCFWGRHGCIGVNADRGHHGESEHDERDITAPSMSGARLVVIEAEFVLRRFETVFDRPMVSFDFRQSFDGRPVRVVKKARSPSAISRL